LDSRESDGKIRVIEYPAKIIGFDKHGFLKVEREYQKTFFDNPSLLFDGAIAIHSEIPVPLSQFRIDLLFKDIENNFLLIELKICNDQQSFEAVKTNGLNQIGRYLNKIDDFNALFNVHVTVIPYLVIISKCNQVMVHEGKNHKPKKHHINQEAYLEWNTKKYHKNGELVILDGLITKQKKKLRNLKRLIKKTETRALRLTEIEELKIEKLKNSSDGFIVDLIEKIDKGEDILLSTATGKNINVVKNLLSQAGIPYLSESKTGYNFNDPELNENNVVHFFFSYINLPSIVLPILESVSNLRYFSFNNTREILQA